MMEKWGEQLLEVAKREFEEETGVKPTGPFDHLGSIRRRSNGKTVEVWTLATRSSLMAA